MNKSQVKYEEKLDAFRMSFVAMVVMFGITVITNAVNAQDNVKRAADIVEAKQHTTGENS